LGWDWRDHAAYQVAVQSILTHTPGPLFIEPIYGAKLRPEVYWRSYRVDSLGQMWDGIDGKPFSSDFSFARFAVPIIEDHTAGGPVIYMDPDVLVKADLRDLVAAADPRASVSVVKHDHKPTETTKMGGLLQTRYERKNWSSVMVFNPELCEGLTPFALNNWSGQALHAMHWAYDIGELPAAWNWLEGSDDPDAEAFIIHYTRGTPDMVTKKMRDEDAWWYTLHEAAESGDIPHAPPDTIVKL
jgi:hypothetical protein